MHDAEHAALAVLRKAATSVSTLATAPPLQSIFNAL